jgi:TrpR-related protein YerC/YecD
MMRMTEATERRRSSSREGGGRQLEPRELEPLDGLDDLADALLTMRSRDELKRLLRDLCTLSELEALGHRWQTARLVEEGVPYHEIAQRVPTSTATVTRVAQWLRHGAGGYRLALERTRARAGGRA